MIGLNALIWRNIKLYFKDKGMFLSSLITPLILLVLYGTFLSNVYEESFRNALEAVGTTVPNKLIGGCVGGELTSSLLAVCCVTVAFFSNMLIVQDKITGARRDLTITPVKNHTLALGYYLAALFSTLLVCLIAVGVCFLYIGSAGWYLTTTDVLYLLLDVFLLVMFGTALSSQGQISAMSAIISAGYGFICGAYMPISQFSDGLQKVISFLPGTYGTSLLRNHMLRGVFEEMGNQGFPNEVVEAIKDSVDCNLYFFGEKVSLNNMYFILITSILAVISIYLVMNILLGKKKK